MINIKVHNADAFKAVGSRLSFRKAELDSQAPYVARLLQQAVAEELQALLGDAMAHFEVRLYGNQYKYGVVIVAIDDIGEYLYHGTKPHIIPAGEGGVLANIETDFGPVYGSVHHPGTRARKPEIDSIMKYALEKVVAFIK